MSIYTSVSISNYNSNAPADDGSNTASNEIKWSGIKTKIGDPLKDAINSVNSNVSTAFNTLAASTGSADVGFIQSGTGAVATTVQAILRGFVFPEMFDAAVSFDSGVSDTAFVQAALNACISQGRKMTLLRMYNIDGYLYMNDTGLTSNYVIEGQGYSTGFYLNGFTTEAACYVNQTSAGVIVQSSYQQWPRVIAENFMIDGSASTNPFMFATNKRGMICRKLYLKGVSKLITTTGHTDQNVIEDILDISGSTTYAMYDQTDFGDQPIIRNIQTSPVDGRIIADITKANGLRIEGSINGIINIRSCTGINIRNCHSEEYNNATINLYGASGVIENNWLMNKDSPAIILNDEATPWLVGYDLKIKDNRFFYSLGIGADYTLDNAVYIDFGAAEATNMQKFDLQFQNNKQYLWNENDTSNLDTNYLGITVGSAHSDVSTLTAVTNFGMFFSSPNVVGIRHREGAVEIYGDIYNVGNKATAPSFATQPTLFGLTVSALTNGETYQYKVACYGQNGAPGGIATSSSITTTAANQGVYFKFSKLIPNSFVRVWRDTASAGTYAEYADIPVGGAEDVTLADRGNQISGVTWAGSAPTVPTLNEYETYQTLSSNTLPVAGRKVIRVGLTSSGTITTFSGGVDGQEVTAIVTNGNATFSFAASPSSGQLQGGSHAGTTWNPSAGESLRAVYNEKDGYWNCITSS